MEPDVCNQLSAARALIDINSLFFLEVGSCNKIRYFQLLNTLHAAEMYGLNATTFCHNKSKLQGMEYSCTRRACPLDCLTGNRVTLCRKTFTTLRNVLFNLAFYAHWRIPFSGMFCLMPLVRTNVSEERRTTINRATRIGNLGTILEITSNSHRSSVAIYG
jgi:hypothetical protein